METVSDRLRRALELPDRDRKSMRQVHRELQAETDFDKAFSTMHSYFTGDIEPPVPFVTKVATVLDVRPEWLFTGSGSAVPIEEDRGFRLQLHNELEGLAHAPHIVTAALIDHLERWQNSQGVAADTSDRMDYLKELWQEDIRGPLDGAPLDWVAFADYALAMIQARNIALRIPTTEEES